MSFSFGERYKVHIFGESHGTGVGVVVECRHLCMMMRGVQKQNSVMVTSSVLGSFHNDLATREEFFALIKGFPK
jgi:GTP cyclohydrolase I